MSEIEFVNEPEDFTAPVAETEIVETPVAEIEFEAAAVEEPAEIEHGTPEYWEGKAAEEGWKPQTDYTGDPDGFVDAKEYVQRGKLLKPLKEAITKRDNDLDNIRRQTASMLRETQKQEKVKYEQLLAHKKQEEKTAFDNADFAGMDKARTEVAQIQHGIQQLDQNINQPEPAPMPPEQAATYDSFLADNKSWYGVDTEKTEMAEALGKGMADRLIGQKIQSGIPADKVDITAEEYKGILTRVAQQFSSTTARPKVSSVQSASNSRPVKAGHKGFGELPTEAKSAFNTMFNHGVYGKDRAKAEKRYVADYDYTPYEG